jgi:FtsH-binding integral membrane protein
MANSRYGISERYGNELSVRAYNLCIGLILLYGFVVNYVMVKYFSDVFAKWNLTLVLIGYFVLCIAGGLISAHSEKPFVSFIGYNMVVVPVGVIVSMILKELDTQVIINALWVTGGVIVVMLVLSTIKPEFFLSLGKVLFIALFVAIIVELIMLLLGKLPDGWWDKIIALLFALYLGYDWAKAQQKEHTLDNAVDSCVDLYMDIINIFVRSASSGSKSKD